MSEWKPISQAEGTDEQLIVVGLYNHRNQWCVIVWSMKYLRENNKNIASGLFENAPHLECNPTHFFYLPQPPKEQA